MQVLYFNSFLRVFKKLPGPRQTQINNVIAGLVYCLENKTVVSSGIGLKKLSLRLWEVRAGIDLRVVFSIDSDALSLVFAGNHDEIRKYLKHNR
ncbi:MAG: hypothetical protein Q7J72_07785 [Candidatus Omnitrophota bacterium]|nr:hypothetical protein [Candidatus Omnitrophota bacterium]